MDALKGEAITTVLTTAELNVLDALVMATEEKAGTRKRNPYMPPTTNAEEIQLMLGGLHSLSAVRKALSSLRRQGFADTHKLWSGYRSTEAGAGKIEQEKALKRLAEWNIELTGEGLDELRRS